MGCIEILSVFTYVFSLYIFWTKLLLLLCTESTILAFENKKTYHLKESNENENKKSSN